MYVVEPCIVGVSATVIDRAIRITLVQMSILFYLLACSFVPLTRLGQVLNLLLRTCHAVETKGKVATVDQFKAVLHVD